MKDGLTSSEGDVRGATQWQRSQMNGEVGKGADPPIITNPEKGALVTETAEEIAPTDATNHRGTGTREVTARSLDRESPTRDPRPLAPGGADTRKREGKAGARA